jgi:hypothetical protein
MLSTAGGAGASNVLPTQGAINLTTAGSGKLATKVLSGGGVAAGAVNYTSTGPSATLTLPSQRTLIDWTTFGVGSTNSLTFDFTSSANAVVLNRVPVGASIVIDKGGAVNGQYRGATGGNIWFLADGGVFIHGKVTASGVLATNNSFGLADLDLLNDNIGALKTNLAAASGLIDLSGTVVASGVEVDAKTGNIILTGEVDASAADGGAGGAINIASPGAVTVSGALDASSRSGVGGAITVTGQSVTLAGASLDASGVLGGGAIRIGGDTHGGGTLVQASATSIDAASTIAADATVRGDGGSVVVWSREQTTFAGQISARGAGDGGDGGSAEVSSHNVLAYTGFTNLTAPLGRTGALVLDPTDLTIDNAPNSNVDVSNPDKPTGSPSVLSTTTLQTQLGGANVVVTTVGSPNSPGEHGDITVAAAVSWATGNSLTLNAAGSIAIDAAITGSSPSSVLALNSAGSITQSAAITVGMLTGSSGSDTTLTGSNVVSTLGPFASSGLLSFKDTTDLTTSGLVQASGGALTLSTTGSHNLTIGTGGAAATLQASAALNLGGIGGTITGGAGSAVTLGAGANFSLPEDITTDGSTTVTITGATFKANGSVLNTTGNALTVSAKNIDLTATGSALTASGAPVSLTATNGTIDEGGKGVVTAATLTGSSVGGATFDTTSNAVGTLGPFSDSSNGNITLADSQALTVTGAVSLGTGTLTLTSAGALAGNGATITAGTLTGSSAGGALFDDPSNAIAKFQNFTNTVGGDVVVATGVNLTAKSITNTVGTIELVSTGSITQSGGPAFAPGVDLILTAGTSLSQSSAPTVARDYTITAASFDATSLSPNFSPGRDFIVNALADFATPAGGFTATRNLRVTSTGVLDTTAGTMTATGGTLALQGATGLTVGTTSATSGASTFSTTTSGNISLQGAVGAFGQTLTLTSAGTISQNATGIIKASTLTGSSVGGTTLNDPTNQIGTFGGFTDSAGGAVKVADSLALTVTGVVSVGTGTLTLVSAGAIAGDGATVTAGTLNGASAGGASFNNSANAIGAFQNFTNTVGGDVVLADGVGLTANTLVNTVGTIELSTSGALSVTGAALAPGVDLILSAGAGLTQANAPTVARDYTITAASFDTASLGPTFAPGRDFTVNSLGDFTIPSGTTLTATRNLKVTSTGSLDDSNAGAFLVATSGSLTLQSVGDLLAGNTTATSGPTNFSTTSGTIQVKGAVNATGQTLTVTSGNTFGETAIGSITAATLTGSSVGVTGLDGGGSNAIGTLGPFSAGSELRLVDNPTVAHTLTVTGAINVGPGGAVSLTNNGAIAADTATITANALSGSSVGGASFNDASNSLFSFSAFTNTGGGDVTVATSQSLGMAGAVNIGSGTLTLTSAGTIFGNPATITAGTLTGSSVGGATFNNASNAVAKFQSFTNATSGDVVLADGVDLTVKSITNTVGSIRLSSAGALAQAGGGPTSLDSGADLILSAGTSLTQANAPTVVRDYSVTAASFDATSLNPTFSPGRDFTVNSLSDYTLTADLTATRSLTVTSTGALDTTGATLTATGGALTLKGATGLNVGATVATSGASMFSTTTSGAISLQGLVDATGQTLTLNSAGAISQNATGVIEASTLTGSSSGGATLGDATNRIGAFGGFTDSAGGSVQVADSEALAVTGVVSIGAGTLTLTSTGAISGDGATITAAALTGSSTGGASFNNPSNAIGTFQAFTNTVSGDVTLADSVDLTASGVVNTVGSVSLSSTGSLSLTGSALNTGQDLILSAGTSLTQAVAPTVVRDYSITSASFDAASMSPTFSPGRDFTINSLGSLTLTGAVTSTRSLTVTSTGVLDTTAATMTATGGTLTLQGATGLYVGATVATSGSSTFSTTTGGNILLLGTVNATGQSVTLTSTGTISADSAVIAASTLTGSSVGGASFDNAANAIDTFGPFSDSANGAVNLADTRALNVTGVVSIGTGTLTLTSAGAITGDGATITAGTLTGSSVGGASFGNASNAIGAFQSFTNLTSGDVVLADGANLTADNIVNSVGSVNLASTGFLHVAGPALAPGQDLILSAGADLAQAAAPTVARDYSITAASFDSTSLSPIGVGRDVTVDARASLTLATNLTAARNLTVTSTGALDATGAVLTATGGTLTLQGATGLDVGATAATSGASMFSTTTSGVLSLRGAVNAAGQTLTLASAGTINETPTGVITASTVTGSSAGGATLNNSANVIGAFTAFTDTAGGNVKVADSETLTVTGAVSIGTGTLTLTSAGSILASGATITARTLTGSSAGGASFDNISNAIGTLGPFSDSANGNVTLADGRALTVTGTVSLGFGVLTLTSTGAISGNGATITAGTLTGSSAGGATFDNASNAIGSLGPFSDTASGNVTVADGEALTVTGAVSVGTGTLTLASAGAISGNAATITAGTLTGSSAGGASFDNSSNAIATFGPFSDTADGNVTLADGRALTVTGTVSLGSGTLTLASTGAISGDGATITAGALTGSSVGGASFNNTSNAIGTFGPFSDSANGDITLADGRPLTVTGAVSLGSGVLTLTSTGAISGNGATITAGTLTGSSAGGASFDNLSNAIGTFGPFSDPLNGDVTVADSQAFTVTGTVSLGTGTLTLISTGAISGDSATITAGTLTGSSVGGATFGDVANAIRTFGPFADTGDGSVRLADSRSLTVTGAVNIGAGTLTLTSTGTIAANGATITAASLTGSSVGGATFDNASNAIGAFGAFSNAGGGDVAVADGETLTVTGAVSIGAGTLTLASSGAIEANGATITAGILTGSSAGGASFNNPANAIATFGSFADTTNGAVTLADGRALTVAGTVSNGTGVLTLISTGAISGNGATITTGTLTGSSAGGASFDNASNAIGTFGSFVDSANGNVTVADSQNLVVTGTVSLGTGRLTLSSVGTIAADTATITAGTLTGSSAGGASFNDASNAIATFGPFADTAGGNVTLADGRGLTVTGVVNIGTGTLTLASTGAIAGNGATITAGTLTGSSAGGASFNNLANAIGAFGPFSDSSNGNVTVADSQSLTVTGAVNIGTGTLTLASAGTIAADTATITTGTLTGSSTGGASFNDASNAIATFGPFIDSANGHVTVADGQSLTVTGAVNIGTGTLTLASAGTIAADTATITAGTLTGSSAGGASFNDASNAIGTFGSFIDSTNGHVTVADGQGLTVTGTVNIGTGTLTLASAGTIGADTATITAAILTGSSVGGASFDNAANAIGTFGPFSNTAGGDITLADSQSLTVTGTFSLGTATLTLASAGTISADTATITAGTLTGSSAGGASFNNPANAIATFGPFADTAGGNVTLADGRGLTVTGGVNIGTGALTLATAGTIAGNGATITAGTLTGSSVGGASFDNAANAIGTFGGFSATGNVTVADGQSLTVTGAISTGTGTLTLVSAGTIAADTATITVGGLIGSSVGGASFNNPANAIATFGPFADSANGNVTLADRRGLTLTGAVNIGTGALTLASAGAIAGNGATITAGTLTGSSTGGASFNNGANAIGTLGPFSDTANGGVTVADGQSLTVTGAISTGTGTLTLVSAGTISADTATITVGGLIGSSVGGASFNDPANAIATFGPFADTAGGNVTVADGRSLTVTGAISIGTGTLTLASAGTIAANTARITAGTLTGSSAGGASFDNTANAIGTFGAFSDSANGNVSVVDGRSLTLTGVVSIGAGTLTLISTRAIAADTATIMAGTLTGSSAGGASFNDASNAVGTLGPYRDTGNGDVTLADGQGLTVTGVVSLGTGTLTIASAGTVAANGATITAGALTGSSVGGASFGGANLFGALAGFTNTGGGAVAITDARTAGFTVTNAVDAGPGATLTLTTTNGGPLTLAANLSASGGTVDLVSAGALDQTAGVITAASLTGSSVGGSSLNGANQLANLNGFHNAGAGDLAITDAAASGLTLTADITVGAGRSVTLTTTGGPLTLGANITASGGMVALASNGVIDQTAGRIISGELTGASAGGASLTSGNLVETLSGFVNRDSGAITLVNAASLAVTGTVDNTAGMAGGAGRDIALTLTSGDLTGPGVFTAARDVALHANGGALSFASATAGDDLVLRAATGVTVAGTLTAAGSASPRDIADPTGAGKVLAGGSPISLFGQSYAVLTDGSHVDVQTAGGDITLGGVTSAAGDVHLQALAGAIHSSDIGAGRAIILDAATTVDQSGAPSNNLTAAVEVAAQAGSGPVDVGAVVATSGDVVLRSAAGAVTLASASAGDDLVVRAATDVTVAGALTSGTGADSAGLADAFLANQPGRALTAFGHAYPGLTAGSPIDIVASTVTVGGAMAANGPGSDVRVVATGADAGTTAALTLHGTINAGQDVALDATGGDFSRSVNGSIAVGGAITAGRDVAARATSGSITLASASAGDDVVLVAPNGAVNLDGSVTATGGAAQGIGATLFATVNSVLDGLFTLGSQSIYIDAISYANTGYGGDHPASLTAGTGIGVSLADTAGLVLADTKLDAGSWIMASTLAAPTISLFETKGNIIVGGAAVNSPVTKLNLYTSDLVMVTGLLAPAADNTGAVTVGDLAQTAWTPSQIDVVNDGGATANAGAIGFTEVTAGVYSTSPRTFNSVSLYATTDILLGTQAFITANAAVTGVGPLKQTDPSRPVPLADANMSHAVMLAVGDLTLVAGSQIVQQNTSGLRTSNGTGYYITRSLTLGAYTPFPPAIDLFGVFVKPGTTIPITGPAAADVTQIFLLPSLAGSPYRGLYRVNSCIIGELGNCTPTSDGIVSIPLDELSKGSLLSRDELDVEDPTITGAPNEEIWRRPDDSK